MTAAANVKTQALEALIEAHAIEFTLPTVRRRFRALADEATRAQQTPVAYLGALLEAEIAERAGRTTPAARPESISRCRGMTERKPPGSTQRV